MANEKNGRLGTQPAKPQAVERASPFNKESEHARKSSAILLEAARAFVHAGFHNTSLQDIANRLGISKPTLCYYVGSKEEILFKCQHTALEHLKLTIPRATQAGCSGLEQLGDFVLELADWTASDFARCLVRCQYDVVDEEALAHLAKERRLIDAALQKIIKRGIEDASIRRLHPALASAAILGSLNWIATWFDPNRTGRSSRDVGLAFLDLFIEGLGNRVPPRRPEGSSKPRMAVVSGTQRKARP